MTAPTTIEAALHKKSGFEERISLDYGDNILGKSERTPLLAQEGWDIKKRRAGVVGQVQHGILSSTLTSGIWRPC